MRSDLETRATLPWLVRLRWLVLAGQLLAALTARFMFGSETVSWVPGVLVGATGMSNVALWIWMRRHPRSPTATLVLGGVLLLDSSLLTALLAVTGGATNPFTVLYLVQITLAAVVLGARWTILIASLAVVCFGLLFVIPGATPDHAHMHGAQFAHHLQGMWAAFIVATGLTAYFVGKIAKTIASQHEEIAALRERAARDARLASLTTLAAGAAHELGTPLGTIAIAAREMELALGQAAAGAEIAEDARLILVEVTRCQEILTRMAARSPSAAGKIERLSVDELGRLLRDRFEPARAARIMVRSIAAGAAIEAPVEELLLSVASLVKNSLDACAGDLPVTVTVEGEGDGARIVVEDAGSGMDAETLARAGEPFFTTKEPGHGLGLGLFLARAFAESRGGSLRLESELGRGTRALLRLVSRPGTTP